MHSYQRRILLRKVTLHKGQVNIAMYVVVIAIEAPLAEGGIDVLLHNPLDAWLLVESITNQVCNRANLQSMMDREFFEIGPPSHSAIFVHDFDDNGRRLACARESGEVAARLRMPGPAQHASGLGHQRKNMPRLAQLLR